MLNEGDAAPEFELPTDRDGTLRLNDLKGQPVVLYFYPKDDTSGCTKEAIAFSELLDEFSSHGAKIIGISPDSPASHDKFRAKHGLSVTLAADTEKAVAEAYGVWVEKSMYGRKYMGVERSTFLLDADGKLAQIWRKVKVPGHVEAVLDAVKLVAT
ncbi:MAG: thioredoxin-dependent thiol peroxidase [Methyloligellaceae bacterium]